MCKQRLGDEKLQILIYILSFMITHVVLFWINKSDTEGREKLLEGVNKLLAKIPQVQNLDYGSPVPSDRAVVDDSFSVAVSMSFTNQVEADAYQTHPFHIQFVNEYVQPYAKRFVIYDWA